MSEIVYGATILALAIAYAGYQVAYSISYLGYAVPKLWAERKQ